MRHWFAVIVFFLVLVPCIQCQEKEDTLSGPGKVYLILKNINFIKNNEYFNPIVEGYTLVGYFIQPEIVFSPSKKVKLQLGTHLLNYAGADNISQVKLVFSTTYNFTENTFLTLGTLNGSDKHRMLDPHFDKERLYNTYVEDGLQFVTENDHIFSDTWVSWENFIFKGDTTREIFTSGESFRFISARLADVLRVEIPIQLQFKHYGGQISNYSEHVETFFNLSGGIRINFDIGQGRLGTAGIEYIQFLFNELTKTNQLGITNGSASWFRFHYKYKQFYFGSYYWRSHDFFAPNGNPIYSSVSDIQKNIIISNRAIWTNSLYLTVNPVDYLEIYLGFDSYYDLNLKRMDTALALHLNFEKLIRLATLNH
jgi:hypothetical protein